MRREQQVGDHVAAAGIHAAAGRHTRRGELLYADDANGRGARRQNVYRAATSRVGELLYLELHAGTPGLSNMPRIPGYIFRNAFLGDVCVSPSQQKQVALDNAAFPSLHFCRVGPPVPLPVKHGGPQPGYPKGAPWRGRSCRPEPKPESGRPDLLAEIGWTRCGEVICRRLSLRRATAASYVSSQSDSLRKSLGFMPARSSSECKSNMVPSSASRWQTDSEKGQRAAFEERLEDDFGAVSGDVILGHQSLNRFFLVISKLV
jgi:hypothetical protein